MIVFFFFCCCYENTDCKAASLHVLTLLSILCCQEVVRKLSPEIVAPNHALRLRAKQDLKDSKGVEHRTGEEWLVRDVGAYLTGIFEEVGVGWGGGGGEGRKRRRRGGENFFDREVLVYVCTYVRPLLLSLVHNIMYALRWLPEVIHFSIYIDALQCR